MYFTAYCCEVYRFVVFKQKTAYEMRISDWSSDVCSSDLRREVPGRSCASGGDHRDGDLTTYGPDQLRVEAVLGAVGVHRVQEDLPRAELTRPGGPLDGVQAGRLAAAVGGDLEAGVGAGSPSGVHRQHQHLVAEPVGDLGDQLGATDGGGVHRDLVRPSTEQAVHVLDRGDSPADRQRDEDLLCGAGDDLHRRGAALVGGRDVQEGQLVRAFGVIGAGQLDRVPGVAQLLEVDALDHAAGIDIETRDDPYGERHGAQAWVGSVSARASSSVKRPS